jgi:site-specific DNA-methyltransferase (adenine-specific)
MLELNQIYNGDCIKLMPFIDNKSIDMILCDLPYGTTACKWDDVIPFEPLWTQYKRIIKDNGAIVLFGSEPFSSYLRLSNINNYKYDWYWNKGQGLNFVTARFRPLNDCETISVFGKGKINYNPIMENANPDNIRPINHGSNPSEIHGSIKQAKSKEGYNPLLRFPKTTININSRIAECNSLNRLHPTQKPVALFEYLIKTYTNEGDLVLDNCIGSGTTAIAAINTKRNWIGIEKEVEYCTIAYNRIKSLDTIK